MGNTCQKTHKVFNENQRDTTNVAVSQASNNPPLVPRQMSQKSAPSPKAQSKAASQNGSEAGDVKSPGWTQWMSTHFGSPKIMAGFFNKEGEDEKSQITNNKIHLALEKKRQEQGQQPISFQRLLFS